MRLLAFLALGLALVSAGCFGGDDAEDGDTTTPTPVTATPTTGTGTGPGTGAGGNGTGTGGNGTETPPAPVTKAPMEVHNDPAADFAHPPTPPATENVQTKTFTVPVGYTKLTLTVNWTTTGPIVAQQNVAVNILAPDGSTVVATCAGPANGAAQTAPEGCTNEGPITAGGDYTAQYKGSGNLKAAVSVVAS